MKNISAAQVIQASAGSGKTTTLTNRYIQLVLANEQPERILATTFTRKAASEIRNRIFVRLAHAAADSKGLAQLNNLLETSITHAQAADALVKLIQLQHRLSICTIDSLLVKIGQSFALESGLPIDWKIADHSAVNGMREEAIRTILKRHAWADLQVLLRFLNQGKNKRSVLTGILAATQDLYQLFLESDEAAWSWYMAGQMLAADELQQSVNDLEALSPVTNKDGKTQNKYYVESLRKSKVNI